MLSRFGHATYGVGREHRLMPLIDWLRRRDADPRLLLALPCGFSLVMLWHQLQPVQSVNDLTFQIPMVEWARTQMLSGHIPLDGWFPNLSLGAAQFHHYQVLPHLVSAFFAMFIGSSTVVLWSTYLLWSLWPISIYWSARLLDRNQGEAIAAALLSPFLVSLLNEPTGGYGFEIRSYMWLGHGLWSQLWGMWFLPLALGFAWRALDGRGRIIWAAVLLAATITSHIFVGYMGAMFVLVLVLAKPSEWRERALRGAAVLAGALALAAWLLVPLVADAAYDPLSQTASGTSWLDSFGLGQVLAWLFTGQIFDSGHFPVISLLAGAGTLLAVVYWKTNPSARAILLCGGVALFCFAGPASFPWLRWLPGAESIWFHRFIAGVQLSGIYLAGAAGYWLFAWVKGYTRAHVPSRGDLAVVGIVGGLVLLSPVLGQVSYDLTNNDWIAKQAAADASTSGKTVRALIEQAQLGGLGRIFAGLRSDGWANTFTVGYATVYDVLSSQGADQVGFTGRVQSISTDPEYNFDETKSGDYGAFAVRYLLLPSWEKPAVPATFLGGGSGYLLYQVAGVSPNYVSVVDTIDPSVSENHANMLDQSFPIMQGQDLQDRVYHPVGFNGAPPAQPTSSKTAQQLLALGPAGSVISERDDLSNGDVVAQVAASRDSVVLLSASFDPRWTATIDGAPEATEMVAPSLVGVAVKPGSHAVEFRYAPYPFYWLWALVALLALAVMIRTPKALERVAKS